MKTNRCLIAALALFMLLSMLSACEKDDFGMGEPGAALDVPEVEVNDEPEVIEKSEPEQAAETTPEPEPEPATEQEPEAEPEPEIESEIEPEFLFYNPLTGEGCDIDYSGFRPYAIMIDNVADALPQDGISAADILYEVTVEGGATRCMGIFIDISKADHIGGVRSCRTTFADVALGYDAIYIHAGSSNEGDAEIQRIGVTHVDALSSKWFYRDSWRESNVGYVHSLCANTADILANIESHDYRITLEEDYAFGLSFTEEPEMPDGEDASEIAVRLSGKITNFVFDAQSGKYLASEYKSDWVDHLTGERLGFENVLLVKTPCRITEGIYYTHTTVGDGTGYFFNNGKVVEINWYRESLKDPFEYTYADGTPLSLGVGKTYIGFVTPQGNVEYN